MLIVKKLSMDMMSWSTPQIVEVVQNDVHTRRVDISLFAGSQPWQLEDGVTCSVAFKKPDGTSGWYDTMPDGAAAVTVDKNTVQALLAAQMLTVPGNVAATIVFQNVQLDRLSTFHFIVKVAPDPAGGVAISNNYYRLQNLEQVNTAVDELQQQLDALIKVDDVVISLDSSWSSKNIVDKLCPSFTESGSVVRCEPVEGYPLEVAWETKNFARADETKDITSGDIVVTTTEGSAEFVVNGTPTANVAVAVFSLTIPPGTYTASVSGLIGTDYATCRDASGYLFTRCSATINPTFTTEKQADLIVAFVFSAGSAYSNTAVKFQIERGTTATAYEPYAETATIYRCGKNLLSTSMVEDPAANQSKTIYSGTLKAPFAISADFSQATVTGPSGAGFLTCTVDGVDSNLSRTMLEAGFTKTAGTLTTVRLVNWNYTTGVVKMQLEAGSVATEWEPHKTAEVFTPGETIPALPGVNTIYADTGLVTVTGKADPVAIINKLTNAVIATGSNV